MLDVQGDLSRKSKGGDGSSEHKTASRRESSVQTEKPACLEKAMTADAIIGTKTRSCTSSKPEGTLLVPGVCCNCALPHCMMFNWPQDVNIQSQVVCEACEGVRCASNSRNLPYDLSARASKGKAASTSREELYKWTKQKLCHCLEKARQKAIQLQAPVTRPMPEKRQEADGELKDLKLVCGRCDCPYLKIASISQAADLHQERSSRQRKRSSNKRNTSSTKLDNTLKPKPISKSFENISHIPEHYCSRRSSKTCAERIPRTKRVKYTNSKVIVENEEAGAEEEECVGKKASVSDVKKQRSVDGARARRNEPSEKNSDREKILESAYRGNRTRIDNARGKKVESNDISDSDAGDNVLKEVKYLQGARSDKALMYVESSSENADVSYSSGDDVNIDAKMRRSSVTSMTFVKRLDKNRKSIESDYETRVSKSRQVTRCQQPESRINVEAFPSEKPEDGSFKLSPPIESNDSSARRFSDHKANGNISFKEEPNHFTVTKRNLPQEVIIESPVELISPNADPYEGRNRSEQIKRASPRKAAPVLPTAAASKNKGSPRDKTPRSTNDSKRVQLRESVSKPIMPREAKNKAPAAGRNIRVPMSPMVRSTKKERIPSSLRGDYCQPSTNPNAGLCWFSPTRSCDQNSQDSKYCDYRGYWCD